MGYKVPKSLKTDMDIKNWKWERNKRKKARQESKRRK